MQKTWQTLTGNPENAIFLTFQECFKRFLRKFKKSLENGQGDFDDCY